MPAETSSSSGCGLDTVELERMEKLLATTPPDQLAKTFTAAELAGAGDGSRRIENLAGCLAAKGACGKLFPKETVLGTLQPHDFSIRRDASGAPLVELSANARAVLDRHRLAELGISLTLTKTNASAVAWTEPRTMDVPWFGKWLYQLFPYRRRVVLGNLRRVFGDYLPEPEIIRIAQAYYAHYVRFLIEFVKLPFMSAEQKTKFIRVENIESPVAAHKQGKGLILLTGHFGNWEVSTVAGIQQFPELKGRFHFVRRPLKPEFFNQFVTRRFRKAGFGTIAKRGSLDQILDLLASGAVVVYVFDQHAGGKDGVVVDFFGHPAGTFKSPALLAMASGAPVIPATSWREPDGTHVLRFEEAIPVVETDQPGEDIRATTRAFNAALERMLLRHPEQWIWMHKRWKVAT